MLQNPRNEANNDKSYVYTNISFFIVQKIYDW
jgi:hypothetical protein